MAGHSKWANIKHKKGAQDDRRGAAFGKLAKEITVAARLGNSGEEGMNPRLRAVIAKARSLNMPKDNIERAIQKGLGSSSEEALDEILYEGYAPFGVALLVRVLTDNKNRSVAEVRAVLSKHGGNLGSTGSVAFLFQRVGILTFPSQAYPEDRLTEIAVELGAQDLLMEENVAHLLFDPVQFFSATEAAQTQSLGVLRAELTYRSTDAVEVSEEKQDKVLRLLEKLEALEDVQEVFSNLV